MSQLLCTAAVALALAGGCNRGAAGAGTAPRGRAPGGRDGGPRQPLVVLTPPGGEPATVKVELARTDAEVQNGLMYRDRLDPGRGMLFFFAHPRRLTFWMHNTLIPLDMIFIGADMKVVGV